jgi:hypothetical protein
LPFAQAREQNAAEPDGSKAHAGPGALRPAGEREERDGRSGPCRLGARPGRTPDDRSRSRADPAADGGPKGSGLSLIIEYITSLPGERGRRAFERRGREGIPIPRAIQGELETLAKRLGVAMFPSSSR